MAQERGVSVKEVMQEVRSAWKLTKRIMRSPSAAGLKCTMAKPEDSFVLDHERELRLIEETLRLADMHFRPLNPLT